MPNDNKLGDVQTTASINLRTTDVEDAEDPSENLHEVQEGRHDGEVRVREKDAQEGDNDGEQLLAGKYKSVEELEKGYQELQKRFSQGDEPDDSATIETEDESEDSPEPNADGTIPTDDEAEEAAEAAGLDLDSVLSEFGENGEVSDETYDRLSEQGMSRKDVDAYLAGQSALADRFLNGLKESVGGDETFRNILSWARDGLDKDEARAYNRAVESGDAATAKMLLRGMKSAYEADTGTDPNLVGGENTPGATGVKPFNSNSEVVKAMSDPRYDTDAAYRREVEKRLAVS